MIAIFDRPNYLEERAGEVGKWGYDHKLLVFEGTAMRQNCLEQNKGNE